MDKPSVPPSRLLDAVPEPSYGEPGTAASPKAKGK
jgi:hypothetical protein